MRTQIMTMTTKATAAILVATAVMSTAAPVVARADEFNSQNTEFIVTEEGFGDVVEDQFVETEGWGDVIDEQFEIVEVVENQGDVIENQFVETEEGWGDVIDEQFEIVEEAEYPDDVIDEQFEIVEEVENQEDVSDDEFAVVSVEDTYAAQKAQKEKAPAVDMSMRHFLLGYHGTRVDYENLVPGKFYLMQIPEKTTIPTFYFRVIKFNESYTEDGKVMVKYDRYKTDGKLESRNRKVQANVTLNHMKPVHFYEITDDIRVK